MRFLRLAAIGAALLYFFDPQRGAGRRAMARDKLRALFSKASSDASGLKQQFAQREQGAKDVDDQALKAKVESEVFRPADSPKGDVNVNVENGVVFLRGQVEQPELIGDLEQRVRSVQGVRGVENLLHVPGTEAPAG
jgi:osmotically-inducible protein OsmY